MVEECGEKGGMQKIYLSLKEAEMHRRELSLMGFTMSDAI